MSLSFPSCLRDPPDHVSCVAIDAWGPFQSLFASCLDIAAPIHGPAPLNFESHDKIGVAASQLLRGEVFIASCSAAITTTTAITGDGCPTPHRLFAAVGDIEARKSTAGGLASRNRRTQYSTESGQVEQDM